LLSTADRSVTVWDLDPMPVLRATLQPTAQPRPSLTLSLGATLAGLSPETRREAERRIAVAAMSVCFLDGDRILVTDADTATVWKLDGGVAPTQVDLSPLSGKATLPAAPTGDLVPVLYEGGLELWELPRTGGGKFARTGLDFTDPNTFRRVPIAGGTAKRADFGNSVLTAGLSADGKWLFTETYRFLRVWNVETGAKRGEIQKGKPSLTPTDIAVTPDGAAVRSIDIDVIRLQRLPGLEPVLSIPRLGAGRHGQFSGFSPDGGQTRIAEDALIAVYDHQPATAVRPLLSPDQT
jgi:hypothetical protein